MPLKLNSSGGGSVTLDVPSTAGTFTATVPANTGTLVTTGSTAAVTPAMLSTGAPNWDSSGNLSFNSGYGSVATAFGCRAWVNFNGTGTIAIRASGNVSSITDNGPGSYGVNFSTAMPDANYACQISIGPTTTGFFAGVAERHITGAISASSAAFTTADTTTGLVDTAQASVAIFR